MLIQESAGCFLSTVKSLGPALVNIPANCTVETDTGCPDKKTIQNDIDNYMVLHAGVAVAMFLLFCLYFPSKPPHPPAPSSAIERVEFWAGVKQIFRNKNVLLLCFSYSMGVGKHNQITGCSGNNDNFYYRVFLAHG